MQEFPRVEGLSKFLLSIADKLENGANGLNKDLLIQTAAKMDALEKVADLSENMIKRIPRRNKGKKSRESLVLRDDVIALGQALRETGRTTKDYV